MVNDTTEARHVAGQSQHAGPARPLHEGVKVKPGRMLEMPKSQDTCQVELLSNCGTSPREISVLQSTKLKGIRDLRSALTSDTDTDFGICPLGFSLALVQYFITFRNGNI